MPAPTIAPTPSSARSIAPSDRRSALGPPPISARAAVADLRRNSALAIVRRARLLQVLDVGRRRVDGLPGLMGQAQLRVLPAVEVIEHHADRQPGEQADD